MVEWLFIGEEGEGPGLSCHSDVKEELVFEILLILIELQARTNGLILLFNYDKLISQRKYFDRDGKVRT